MAVPYASATFSIMRPKHRDGGEEQTYTRAARGVRGHLGSPSSTDSRQTGGSTTQGIYRFTLDPCDLRNTDLLLDETTGVEYQVSWTLPHNGPLPHRSGQATLSEVRE